MKRASNLAPILDDTAGDHGLASDEASGWPAGMLAGLLTPEPLTGREIVEAGLAGGWANQGIEDSQAWVEARRSERRSSLGW